MSLNDPLIPNEPREIFDPGEEIKGDADTSMSPSGRFRADTNVYRHGDPKTNLEITRVKVLDHVTNQLIVELYLDEDHFFHDWLEAGGTDYLITAEQLCGGQTIVDLTHLKMASYFTEEDGFIWTHFYLSPDGTRLAVIGCYWACPNIIKVYDFAEPTQLPLPQIMEIEMLGDDEKIMGWLDNETLQLKGIKRKREPEYDKKGSFSMKVVSETPVERTVRITS